MAFPVSDGDDWTSDLKAGAEKLGQEDGALNVKDAHEVLMGLLFFPADPEPGDELTADELRALGFVIDVDASDNPERVTRYTDTLAELL
jgi:hypothetical protein